MILFFCSKCCVCLLHYIYKDLPPPLPHSIHPFGVCQMVLEHYLAADACTTHYIYACGLAYGGGGAAIHLASLHVVEGQVQLLRVVEHAALHAYALRHGCRWHAGGACALQIGEFTPDLSRLVGCQRCGGHIYGYLTLLNAILPTVGGVVASTVISVRPVHSPNANVPMLSRLSGRLIFVSFLHQAKAYSAMLVTPVGTA